MSDARYPFGRHPLKESRLQDRLLRRPRRENALIELTNRLSDGVQSVTFEQVRDIESSYSVDFSRDFAPERQMLFTSFIEFCYADTVLEEQERLQVDHLQSLLKLDDATASEVVQRVEQDVYRAAVKERFIDRRLSDEEDRYLSELQRRLKIEDHVAESIKQAEADSIVREYLNRAVDDGLLSPEEEAEVRLAVSNLGFNFNLTPEQQQRWDRFRLYWDLQFGAMEPVPVNINLQSSETCYFTAPTQWWERRTETRTIRYSGPSARVRIAKGVYWRTGSTNIERVTEEVLKPVDTGQLYITNKRVIFVGHNRNTNLRLNRILDFTLFTDGIELVKDSGRNPVFQLSTDIDIAALVLNRLLVGDPPLDTPSRIEVIESQIEMQQPHVLEGGDSQVLPASTQSGLVGDQHYTEYVEEVKQLKRDGRHTEALELLNRLVEAVERESEETGHRVAPWYYEQMAIIYRKEKDYMGEVQILQRYEDQRKRIGSPPDSLTERLTRAQSLALGSSQ